MNAERMRWNTDHLKDLVRLFIILVALCAGISASARVESPLGNLSWAEAATC